MQTSSAQLSLPSFPTDEARYQAVRARDRRAEGQFYYGVVTTGVYCRPTCAARPALRANVRFHATAEEAERAGFRPCLRCQPRGPSPQQRQAELVAAARARIEASDGPVKLADLAAGAGLSPSHFQRLFRSQVGLTPREYAAACRLRRFDEEVRDGSTVTAAIHEAGYSSSSRFYEGSGTLGMTPSQLRRGAAGLTIRWVIRPCSLGQALIAATPRGVCAIFLADRPDGLDTELRARFPRASLAPADSGLQELAAAVVKLIDSAGIAPELPVDLLGTAFQQRVWRALREIPRGTTVSYAELARRIGAPRAVRAVGTACGANPVAVAIPCHRVLRGDGALGGYRWGLGRKKALLARERSK
jgi:AraC family transcriptional regulator of adaptative response/methylated-DNA-[protein]-cysteine methyltransferase